MNCSINSTIRGAVAPDHSSGTRPAFHWHPKIRAICPGNEATLANLSAPPLTVIGRSVFGRSVRHGMRNQVVPSCSPPESVNTIFA